MQGFLVESKLLKLLAPLGKDDQSLMKLDAIFEALHVDNEDDIHRLATYFINNQTAESSGETPAADVAAPVVDAATEERADSAAVDVSCVVCYWSRG